MASPVNLNDAVRRKSELQSKSGGCQTTQSPPGNRAVGGLDQVDQASLETAPEGEFNCATLSTKEQEAWLNNFVQRMSGAGPVEQLFFGERQQLKLGVGLDRHSNLVRADCDETPA